MGVLRIQRTLPSSKNLKISDFQLVPHGQIWSLTLPAAPEVPGFRVSFSTNILSKWWGTQRIKSMLVKTSGLLIWSRRKRCPNEATCLVTNSGPTHCNPMGFPRQEYWSGLPFPPPEDLPDPGIEPTSPTLAAAAAKSLQSCPILCNPVDGSPPGSSGPGILQARILEWAAISFSRGNCSYLNLDSTPAICRVTY